MFASFFKLFFIVFSFVYQRQFHAVVINWNCKSIHRQRYDKLCILLEHKECVFVGCNQPASFITSAQFGRWKVTHDNMCHLNHNLWHTTEFIISHVCASLFYVMSLATQIRTTHHWFGMVNNITCTGFKPGNTTFPIWQIQSLFKVILKNSPFPQLAKLAMVIWEILVCAGCRFSLNWEAQVSKMTIQHCIEIDREKITWIQCT